jgi:hypothetical protein
MQITGLGSKCTHVRLSNSEPVTLRRSSCILHGRGRIGLGRVPQPGGTAMVESRSAGAHADAACPLKCTAT